MPDKPADSSPSEPSGDLWLGGALVALAVTVITLAQSIRSLGLGENHDPGSKAFPIGLAIILGISGIIEGVRGWQSRKRSVAAGDTPAAGHRGLILIVGLGIYVFLIPWAGFALSTLAMGTAMLRWLGSGWGKAVLISIGLVALVYALFVLAFKVPLPGGVIGLPF